MIRNASKTTIGELLRSQGGEIKTGPFGTKLKAAEYTPEGVPVISVGEIQPGRLVVHTKTPRVNSSVIDRMPEYLLAIGDIVFARKGSVERSAVVLPEQNGWFLGSDGIRLRLPSSCNPRFFGYQIASQQTQNWLVQHSTGSTMASLNQGIIERIPVWLPDRKFQDRIADILGTLDDKIELNRRINETLEAMARRLFRSWFVDFDPIHAKAAVRREHPKLSNADLSRHALPNIAPEIAELFPDELEDSTLGPIPKGWKTGFVPDAIDINPTRSLPKGTFVRWLEMSNMPTRSARALAWEKRAFSSGTKFINGDTLVARITPCLENGKTAFVDFLNDGEVGAGSTEYIVLRPKPLLPPCFAYLLARTESFRQHLIANMTGTSGRQRAPANCLNSFQVTTPPPAIAEHFAQTVTALFAQMKTNDEQSVTLTCLRDKLLPRLLSGELQVDDRTKHAYA